VRDEKNKADEKRLGAAFLFSERLIEADKEGAGQALSA
jgi:hypothetical protein